MEIHLSDTAPAEVGGGAVDTRQSGDIPAGDTPSDDAPGGDAAGDSAAWSGPLPGNRGYVFAGPGDNAALFAAATAALPTFPGAYVLGAHTTTTADGQRLVELADGSTLAVPTVSMDASGAAVTRALLGDPAAKVRPAGKAIDPLVAEYQRALAPFWPVLAD